MNALRIGVPQAAAGMPPRPERIDLPITRLLRSTALLPANIAFNSLRVLSGAGTLAIGMLLLSGC
jgi:hypothetical protein